jgi:hypothetical protein
MAETFPAFIKNLQFFDLHHYFTTSPIIFPNNNLLELLKNYYYNINNYIFMVKNDEHFIILLNKRGEIRMYSVLFTSFLVIILIWKLTRLLKNKQTIADYESIDEDLVIMLNDGDNID